MAKKEKPLLFSTFLLSCVAVALLIVSFSTTSWVIATPEAICTVEACQSVRLSDLNYGLFKGTYVRRILATPETKSVHMTCLFAENVCMMTCKNGDEGREELELLLNGKSSSSECNSESKTTKRATLENPTKFRSSETRTFINTGIWVCTLLFLVLSIVLAVTCGLISVLNTATNPVETIFSIFGLVIWNAAALFVDVLIMLLWGIHFAVTLSNNVGIRDTIVGEFTSDGYANLGYSFWLLFPVAVIHLLNIGILLLRNYLMNKEPTLENVPVSNNTDGTLFLY